MGETPRASKPELLPRKSPMGGRGRNSQKNRKETAQFSAKGVLRILIQDEMRPCLRTTTFSAERRALSVTRVFQ